MLSLLDFLAARRLEMRERGRDVAAGDGPERLIERDRVFHGELGAGADREMRGRLGVADQHDIVVCPAFATDGREIAPERAVDDEFVTGHVLGEYVLEMIRRLRLVR